MRSLAPLCSLAVLLAACYEGLPLDAGAALDTGGSTGPQPLEAADELAFCAPGEVVACYPGPEGTRDVGLCRAGVRSCGPDGQLGRCEAAVLPVHEDCDTPEDDDCNGSTACGGFVGALVLQSADATLALAAAPGRIYLAWRADDVVWLGRFPADGAPPVALGAGVAASPLRLEVEPASGDLLLAATLDGPLGLPTAGEDDCVATGDPDVLVARFNPTLQLRASRCLGDGSAQRLTDLALDPTGALLLTGTYEGALSLPDGTTAPLDSAVHELAFVVRLAPDLQTAGWARSLDLGGPSPLEVPQLAAGADGSAVLFGTVRGGFDDRGGSDVFLGSYGPDGDLRWTRRIGNPDNQRAVAIDIGPEGDLWIAGESAGALDLGIPHLGDDAPFLTFVARIDRDTGATLAARHIAGVSLAPEAGAQALAADSDGEVVLAGRAFAELSFVRDPAPAGGYDFLLFKLDEEVAPLWHHRRGDDANQSGFAVIRHVDGGLLVAGDLQGELDLSGASLAVDHPTSFVAGFLR